MVEPGEYDSEREPLRHECYDGGSGQPRTNQHGRQSENYREESGGCGNRRLGQTRANELAMPVITGQVPHREQIVSHEYGFYACTARSVDRKERVWNKEAQAALQKEWDRLRSCGKDGCWDEKHPKERREVEREARDKGAGAHFESVFDICVEKNHHLPAGSAGRKSKGRAE